MAATADGLPRHDLAWIAFRLGAALCGQRQDSVATFCLDLAFAGADPDSDLAVMARMQASVASRRSGQLTQALE